MLHCNPPGDYTGHWKRHGRCTNWIYTLQRAAQWDLCLACTDGLQQVARLWRGLRQGCTNRKFSLNVFPGRSVRVCAFIRVWKSHWIRGISVDMPTCFELSILEWTAPCSATMKSHTFNTSCRQYLYKSNALRLMSNQRIRILTWTGK